MILIKYTRYNNKDMISFCEAASIKDAEELIAKLLQLKHVTEAEIVENENVVCDVSLLVYNNTR